MDALPPPQHRGPGGQGGTPPPSAFLPAFPLEDVSRSDARMMASAVKSGRWPMSPETREKVLRTLEFVATADPWGQLYDGRTMVAAAKALIDADKINVEVERREAKAPEVVIELGPDGKAVERIDFSRLTDDEIEAYIQRGGRA